MNVWLAIILGLLLFSAVEIVIFLAVQLCPIRWHWPPKRFQPVGRFNVTHRIETNRSDSSNQIGHAALVSGKRAVS